jgi:hypothetical protein
MLNHKITFCDKTVKCIAVEDFPVCARVTPLTVHRELMYHNAQRFGSLTDEW